MDEDWAGLEVGEPDDRLLALDESLTRFAEVDPAKAELVRLRLYAGLNLDEAAATLASISTVQVPANTDQGENAWTFNRM